MPTPGLKLTSTENDDLEELFGYDVTAEPTAAATAKGLARSVRSVWEYGTKWPNLLDETCCNV